MALSCFFNRPGVTTVRESDGIQLYVRSHDLMMAALKLMFTNAQLSWQDSKLVVVFVYDVLMLCYNMFYSVNHFEVPSKNL